MPGHGRLTGVFATARAQRGETVGLRLDPAGCHLFAPPTDGAPDAAAAAPTGPRGQCPAAAMPDTHALSG